MKDDIGILWAMYQEQCTMRRHHASQRGAATNLIVTICGAILGLITFDKEISRSDLPLAGFIVFLGLYGALLSAKHYELFAKYRLSCDELEYRLDKLLPSAEINTLIETVKIGHKKAWPRLTKFKIFWLWTGIHIFMAALGLLLVTVAFLN